VKILFNYTTSAAHSHFQHFVIFRICLDAILLETLVKCYSRNKNKIMLPICEPETSTFY